MLNANTSTFVVSYHPLADWLLAGVGLTLLALVAFVLATGEAGPDPSQTSIAELAFLGSLIGFGYWSAMVAIGGLWRLIVRRPLFEFDGDRLHLHPSVHRGPVSIEHVDQIELIDAQYMGGTAPLLCVRLTKPYWSVEAKLPTKLIELRFPGQLQERNRAAQALLNRMVK